MLQLCIFGHCRRSNEKPFLIGSPSFSHQGGESAVQLRKKYTPYIFQTVKASAKSGEPVSRNLEYVFPIQGYAEIKDQFLIGDRLMVAPVLDKTVSRMVVFPKGNWKAQDGKVFKGPMKVQISAGIGEVLAFDRME